MSQQDLNPYLQSLIDKLPPVLRFYSNSSAPSTVREEVVASQQVLERVEEYKTEQLMVLEFDGPKTTQFIPSGNEKKKSKRSKNKKRGKGGYNNGAQKSGGNKQKNQNGNGH